MPALGVPLPWAVLIAAYYLLLVSAGGRLLLEPVPLGLVFNSMATNLLQGRLDVDPAAIGIEAFVRDGRTYAYFGIFPALLRLPLLPVLDLATIDVSRISVAVALTIGALASARAVTVALRALPPGPFHDAIRDRLVLVSLLSGPPILLAFQVAVYEEAIAWSWAMASLFIASALRALTTDRGFGTGTLAAMAVAAGVCLLTRPSTALGLYVTLALMMLWLMTRRDGDDGPPWRRFFRRLSEARIVVPTLIALLFVSAAAGVNWARWGNPFVVADMRAYVHFLEAFPERIARLETYGMFSLQRIPYGVAYYFVPVWMLRSGGEYPLKPRIVELFDSYELPAASLLISDALTLTLAIVGVGALLRGRTGSIPRPGAAALVAGLCISPALMLMAWYMAFRYRAEFAPVLTTLACFGATSWILRAGGWTTRKRGAVQGLVIALFIVQIVSAHVFGLTSGLLPRGIGLHHMTDGIGEVYWRCLILGCSPAGEGSE